MLKSMSRRIGVRDPIPGVNYPPIERLRKYIESGALGEKSLTQALIESFDRHARKVALCAPEGDVSYAELQETTDRFAAGLIRLGLEPLDRVLFQVGNCKELVFAFVGCLKAGLIPICTLPAHREREIEYLGCHADASAHIIQGDDPKFDLLSFALKTQVKIPTLRHVISLRAQPREDVQRFEDLIGAESAEEARRIVAQVERDPYQVAIFQLSGGTTGVPKIIPRLQNDFLLNAQLTAQTLGYCEADVMFMPMPMIHNACMICFWLPSLLAGAAYAIPGDMTPEAWGRVFTEKRPTFLGLIRALIPRLDAMVERGLASIESVRACWCPDAARLMREKYGIPTYAMFGMSEGMNMYTRAGDPAEALDWTVGRPLSPFDEVRLVIPGTDTLAQVGEIGEFWARGPYTINGYYNAPERNQEAFTRDGFFKTGDLLISREIEGNLYYAFAGRTKDVVDRGTEKINCEEVEHAVSTHPSVSVCAVIGMPDPVLGERVCAYVVLRDGFAVPSLAQMSEHMRGIGFAKFKWPERIEVIAALPLTGIGKLDKARLREDIQHRLSEDTPVRGAPIDEGDAHKEGGRGMHQSLKLHGVHHTARPTWKLKETVEFYRDILGLPLIHSVSARGWGREQHPDFLHFFFDSGAGSTIAFFYYLAHPQPDHLVHHAKFDSDAVHTAWRVETREELMAWRERLERRGVPIMFQIEHEVIESIYFRDPNGYFLEITRPLRELNSLDAVDADLTMRAAIAAEEAARRNGGELAHIEVAWRAKGDMLMRADETVR
jgi:2,3-dihydroxybenzoate-AMP ligase